MGKELIGDNVWFYCVMGWFLGDCLGLKVMMGDKVIKFFWYIKICFCWCLIILY